MELALEAGADDVIVAGGAWEITCPPTQLHKVREAIAAAGIEPDSAEITMLPQTTVSCDAGTAGKVLRLIEALDDHDDSQKVYHNAEIPDELIAGS